MTTLASTVQRRLPRSSRTVAVRLVAHVSGVEGGAQKLKIDLPVIATTADTVNQVQLVISGEAPPLVPWQAASRNGILNLTFFWSEIFRKGCVPIEAVVRCKAGDKGDHRRAVQIEPIGTEVLNGGRNATRTITLSGVRIPAVAFVVVLQAG